MLLAQSKTENVSDLLGMNFEAFDDDGGEDAGPCSTSNTGASKLQGVAGTDVQRVSYDLVKPAKEDVRYTRTGGVDWFEGCFYLNWDAEKFAALSKALDAEQDNCADLKPQLRGFCQLPGSRGQWKVRATGCPLGPNMRCRWVFERDGVIFGLVNRVSAHKTRVSGFFRITGEVCLAIGDIEDVWNNVQRWFAELGAQIVKATLSRVDLCVDLPGVSVEPFVNALRNGRIISRIRHGAEHHSDTGEVERDNRAVRIDYKKLKCTGLTIIGHNAMVRIYDKAEECKDLLKRAWIIHRRWGGKDQDTAARVEFELKRDFLTAKKCKAKPNEKGELELNRPAISTVEDFFDKLPDLVRYLTCDWMRFVKEGYNNKHSERATDMDLWVQVQNYFVKWADANGPTMNFKPLRRAEVLIDSFWKQIRGVAEAAAARLHVRLDGPDDLLGFLNESIQPVIETDLNIGTRVRGKTNMIARVISDDDITHSGNFAPDDDPIPF